MRQTELAWCWCLSCKRWFVEVDSVVLRKRPPSPAGPYDIDCRGEGHTTPTVPSWVKDVVEAEPKRGRKKK